MYGGLAGTKRKSEMTKPKFTPGPWVVLRGETLTIEKVNAGTEIADLWDNPNADRLFDAHLIAAAPDLYAALEEICDQSVALRQGGPAPEDLQRLSEALEYAVDIAVSALAKARGEG